MDVMDNSEHSNEIDHTAGEIDEEDLIYEDQVLETISLSDDEETHQKILTEEMEELEMEDRDESETASAEKLDDASGCFRLHTGSVFAVAVNPSCTVAVSGGEDDKGYVWKLSSQELLFECPGHRDSVTCVGFSHDGKYVSTADMSGLIQVWRVDNSQLIQSYETSDIEWMIWHGQAHILIVGTSEGTGWLWRLPSGDCKTLPGHGCKNTCATILAGGKKAACGYEDGSVRIWDLKSSKPVASHTPLPMKDSPITCLASDGTLVLSGHVDGSIRLFNDSLKVLMVFSNQGPSSGVDDASKDEDVSVSIEAVAFISSHQLIVTGSLSGKFCIWDIPTKKLRKICSLPAGVTRLVVSPSPPVVYTGCLDGVVRALDPLSGSCLKEWHGHQDEILDLALTRDEAVIVTSSSDHTVRTFPNTRVPN